MSPDGADVDAQVPSAGGGGARPRRRGAGLGRAARSLRLPRDRVHRRHRLPGEDQALSPLFHAISDPLSLQSHRTGVDVFGTFWPTKRSLCDDACFVA